MPIPFPGMDPYLEDKIIWNDCYHALVVYLRTQLVRQIRPRYAARLDVRYRSETLAGERLVRIFVFVPRTQQIITAIELLKPCAKMPDTAGRVEYLQHRDALLQAGVSLLEIDLLRAGERVPMLDPLPDAPYFVFLSRGHRRPQCEVWPVGLRDPLPVVPVPLLAPDADAQLDLGAALREVYAGAGYDGWIDYTQPPPDPPLSSADAAWLDAVLREHGVR